MKSGGILRTSVPDFAAVIKIYQQHENVDGIGILGPIFGRIEIDTENGKETLFHKTVYDFNSLKKVMEDAGFCNFRKYDAHQAMPENYDDFSMAYYPHMDRNGIPVCLNVVCEK